MIGSSLLQRILQDIHLHDTQPASGVRDGFLILLEIVLPLPYPPQDIFILLDQLNAQKDSERLLQHVQQQDKPDQVN